MNKKQKRNFFISTILILLAVVFTILVKVVDVKAIGVNGTNIGFASLNQLIFKITGVNMIWYHITDWLGLIPVFMAIIYAFVGLIQLIKRKSIFKLDTEIILLGVFYIIVIVLYVFFEKVIINYRPVLINGFLEASYPSSHTLITICICVSSILINKRLFNNKITKVIDIISVVILVITVVGRLVSGVHWFTDIIGGILISSSLLMLFYTSLNTIKKRNRHIFLDVNKWIYI